MQHPLHLEYEARKSWVTAREPDGRLDWCRAGGLTNFAAVGILGDSDQYGRPHVVDCTSGGTTNCIFCGKDIMP